MTRLYDEYTVFQGDGKEEGERITDINTKKSPLDMFFSSPRRGEKEKEAPGVLVWREERSLPLPPKKAMRGVDPPPPSGDPPPPLFYRTWFWQRSGWAGGGTWTVCMMCVVAFKG